MFALIVYSDFASLQKKKVKFYGKSISDFALFTFQKLHLAPLKFPVRACMFRFSLVNPDEKRPQF